MGRRIETDSLHVYPNLIYPNNFLKGAQVWDFDLLNSNDFYIMKFP